jgi:hypothetical protein
VQGDWEGWTFSCHPAENWEGIDRYLFISNCTENRAIKAQAGKAGTGRDIFSHTTEITGSDGNSFGHTFKFYADFESSQHATAAKANERNA